MRLFRKIFKRDGIHVKKRRFRAILFVAGFLLAILSAGGTISAQSGYISARFEYSGYLDSFHKGLENPADINEDYVGWISVDGTSVNYPVVRGPDNAKYLNTTFGGKRNASGAVFMDYRCDGLLGGAVSVLYGHNMKDGSMFAGLKNYLDKDYLAEHKKIVISKAEGGRLVYEVISAFASTASQTSVMLADRLNDYIKNARHAAYAEAGNVPRFLVLSTCVGVPYSVNRIIVYAVLKGTVPI